MNTFIKLAVISLTALAVTGNAATLHAQNAEIIPSKTYGSATVVDTQNFTKKRYSIKGTWSVSEVDGQSVITFNDDFKTKGGPDLKLFLSSEKVKDLDSGTVEPTSVKLSVLKSNNGAQRYIIPDDIDLTQYKSVVIHCEAFSVLWGGFDL